MHVLPAGRDVGSRAGPPSRRDRRWLWITAAVFGVVAVVLAGIAISSLVERSRGQPAYRTISVREGLIQGVLRASGPIDFDSIVRVGSIRAGQVTSVPARVGDTVKRGAILARLDNLEQRAAVRSADAQVAVAQVEVIRAEARLAELLPSADDLERLDDSFVIPSDAAAGEAQLNLMAAAARHEKQLAALNLAQGLLARQAIRAPTDGVVVARSVEPGETVMASPPGPPLFIIDPTPGRLVLWAAIGESHAARVETGPARVTVDALPDRSFLGTVVGVSHVADDADEVAEVGEDASGVARARYEVRVEIDNADGTVKPGMSATVELPMSSTDTALHVPESALDRSRTAGAGREVAAADRTRTAVLWLVPARGPLTPVSVTLGVSNGSDVEVRGPGLVAGQNIATPPR